MLRGMAGFEIWDWGGMGRTCCRTGHDGSTLKPMQCRSLGNVRMGLSVLLYTCKDATDFVRYILKNCETLSTPARMQPKSRVRLVKPEKHLTSRTLNPQTFNPQIPPLKNFESLEGRS